MYLTKINPKTGLLLIEDGEDGILAIKEFRDILYDDSLKIEGETIALRCLTAIALTADYQSKINYYDDNDRPRKAQEEVTGDRYCWQWNIQPIQAALKKYEALQYDPTLEEKQIYYNQKVKKLKQIDSYDSWTDEEKKKTRISDLRTELRAINKDIEDFEKRNDGKDLHAESPVVNGYSLSRLEQKLEARNSFYHQIR